MKRLGLLGILAVALGLRLYGLGFGLPNAHHAYPYNPDEWTPMRAFRGMRPAHLDFNPHYFDNPTFFYYLLGVNFLAADRLGWVNVRGNERFYFEHPEHLARMLWLGRLCAVAFGTATVWLVYRLGRASGLSRDASRLAALLLAVHPSHVVHSHFMTVNTAATFWTVATLLMLGRWVRKGGAGASAFAGITTGLAISTKYSAALLLPLVALAGVLRARGLRAAGAEAPGGRALREAALVGSATLAAFVAGSPYTALAFGEFRQQLAPFVQGMFGGHGHGPSWHQPLGTSLSWISRVHLFASTPPFLLAAFGGVVVSLRRPGPFRVLALSWLGAFLVLSLGAAHLATDSRFLPAFPVLAVLGATGLGALLAQRRALGLAAAAVVVGIELAWSAVLLGRFTGPMPQEQASQWAVEHLRDRERILLAGTAVYWNPDIPLREYLQARHRDDYERRTRWTFVAPDSFGLPYAEVRRLEPDVVFLTEWLPSAPAALEWLHDPDYRVVASFPGKIRVFGRRVAVPLDLYDVDTWVLVPRRRAG